MALRRSERHMTDPVPIAMGQGSSCWGCYQSLVDIHLGLADVLPLLDIKYWQAVADFKLHHLESYPDKSVVVGLYEGMARTEEDVHLLKLLRDKRQILIAFGSCSCFGGIPGMANFSDIEECYDVKFRKNRTVKGGKVPSKNVPPIERIVRPNNSFVDIDIYLPGCPPTSKIIATAVTALLTGQPIELSAHAVCHYCDREKKEEPVEKWLRDFEGIADPDRCLLEQGYMCVGSSTWGVCEAQCPNAGAPCKGCHGPVGHFMDHGAATIAMLGSYGPLESEEMQAQIKDPLGSFWRFTYPTSHLGQIRLRREEKK
jgi:F420-non-reducing hydrogenase small subunit